MRKIQKFFEFYQTDISASNQSLPHTDCIVIKDIKIINGENQWSESKTKLIHMILDLDEFEEFPSNKIPNFYETLTRVLPSLYTHRCSVGISGGFFSRVREGTWLGHIVEHIALELQTLAGMNTGWGRTRGFKNQKGVYNVVFNFTNKDCGVYAARKSVKIVKDIINGSEPNIENVVNNLRKLNY